jgi:hypothetical protein
MLDLETRLGPIEQFQQGTYDFRGLMRRWRPAVAWLEVWRLLVCRYADGETSEQPRGPCQDWIRKAVLDTFLSTSLHIYISHIMRWSILSLLLSLVAFVAAYSSAGNRLLVVLEDQSKKDLYSKFWGDLKCNMPNALDLLIALSD